MPAVDLDQDRRNKHPRILTEAERERLDEYVDQIHYSSRYGFGPCHLPRCLNGRSLQKLELLLTVHRYSDDENEYRHVQLPKDMIKRIPKDYFDPSKGTLKLLWDEEWRSLGITQVSNLRLFSQDRCDLTVLSLRA